MATRFGDASLKDKLYVAFLSAGQDFQAAENRPMAVEAWQDAVRVDPNRPDAQRALAALTPTPVPTPAPPPAPAPQPAAPPRAVNPPLPTVCQQYASELQKISQLEADLQAIRANQILGKATAADIQSIPSKRADLRQATLQSTSLKPDALRAHCPGVF